VAKVRHLLELLQIFFNHLLVDDIFFKLLLITNEQIVSQARTLIKLSSQARVYQESIQTFSFLLSSCHAYTFYLNEMQGWPQSNSFSFFFSFCTAF